MEYPSVVMGLGYAAMGGAVLFLLAGVFAFMEKVFRMYLQFRGYQHDEISVDLPELKDRHHGAWYWIRAGFLIAPLFAWVVFSYLQMLI